MDEERKKEQSRGGDQKYFADSAHISSPSPAVESMRKYSISESRLASATARGTDPEQF
jgi:hypothetical protein